MLNLCPLCDNKSKVFYKFKKKLFHQCENCKGIFVDKQLRPNKDDEKSRYIEHNNDVEDINYQNFVAPITAAIIRDFSPQNKGLDFGAGTGPVISKVLKDNKFQIKLYDPFFHNDKKLLEDKYDYIACCEVIEHFYHPKKEFVLLKSLLKHDAKLYCMTSIYNEGIDFHGWQYKNDQTHVFIYHKKTLEYIKTEFRFSKLIIEDRLVTYIK